MTEFDTHVAFDAIPDATPDDGIVQLPVILMQSAVVFPHTINPLPIDGDKDYNKLAAQHAIDHQTTVIHCRLPHAMNRSPLLQQIETIGTEVAVMDITQPEDAMTLMMVQGRRRVQMLEIVQEYPFIIARARLLTNTVRNAGEVATAEDWALDLFGEIIAHTQMIPDEIEDFIYDIDDPAMTCDILASAVPLPAATRQSLLDEIVLDDRYTLLLDILQQEVNALDVRENVNAQVQDEITRVQREMYLREQMRVIQQELGEGEGFERDALALRDRIDTAALPDTVRTQALKELARLHMMSPMSPESGVIRTYLEWVLDLPWGHTSADNLDLDHARRILDDQHYGLETIKERILEHIAVRQLAGDAMRTPIICFVGPPGVGKTSLGKSIAQALGREFVRVSLGGVRDEAEIRGHRRTYIGALPGRIIQTMKRAGTSNPVFMLDEIDKMSEDYRGDPAAALLEVLDPEQNHEFGDHYLEMPYDLSQVMFIATANDLYPLPEALEDRMEIIEFNAYTGEEKLEIAKRFLIPKQLQAHGLSDHGIQLLDDAVRHVIEHYTMEAGVRNLERELANICRKLTKRVAMQKKHPKRITANIVEQYLGPPQLIDSHLIQEDNIGLATGLVWTSAGGDIQIIEASLLPGKGNLTLTGQLGDVLQESAQIALNYMRARADDLSVPHDDFDAYDVHIHLPEGAVPKDGPSAGITLATAIISVFTERKIRCDVAMTGEVTLRGHILGVGGVKEKVLAARRRGIKHVILPEDNRKDLADLPKKARRDMTIHFVKHMQAVMDIMLADAPDYRQRDHDVEDDDADFA